MSSLFKNSKSSKTFMESFRIFIVLFSSIIYSLAVVWFLEPVGIYSAGVSGVAQIIVHIIEACGGSTKIFSIGFFVFVINVPIIIIGWRHVSFKFSLYSILSVLCQTIFLAIPKEYLFLDFGINIADSTNYSPLACCIVGGLISGFGCGLALRYGTSTGGVDILAQAYAFKSSRISIGTFSMISNVLIGVVGGTLIAHNLAISLYTFIRIILTSVVMDKLHTAYNYLQINIITNFQDEITTKVFQEVKRGCTIIPVEGAYTHNRKWDLFIVVSSYELDNVVTMVKEIDPTAFIVVSPVKMLYGNFTKKTIA